MARGRATGTRTASTSGAHVRALALGALAVLLAAGAGGYRPTSSAATRVSRSAMSSHAVSSATPGPSLRVAALTTDGTDAYSTTYDDVSRRVHVTALPTNHGGNDRRVLWPLRDEPSVDGESCARWPFEDGRTQVSTNVQQGAALRIRTNADGSTDALTVTRNMWLGIYWAFNVHRWHAQGGHATYESLGSFDLANLVVGPGGVPAALPWNLCARVTGTQLSFVVWLAGERRPAYGTAGHGGTVTLSPADVRAGYSGWYIGHLTAGQSADFDRLTPSPSPSPSPGPVDGDGGRAAPPPPGASPVRSRRAGVARVKMRAVDRLRANGGAQPCLPTQSPFPTACTP